MRKKYVCPNFDDFRRKPITMPFVVDGKVIVLHGICRGFGAIHPNSKAYEATIGVYERNGDYFNLKVDLRVQCALATFWIDDADFYFPIVEYSKMLVKVDPQTGSLVTSTAQRSPDPGATVVDKITCPAPSRSSPTL
jgi:hypothetical protein